jgi:hypothetical protein
MTTRKLQPSRPNFRADGKGSEGRSQLLPIFQNCDGFKKVEVHDP